MLHFEDSNLKDYYFLSPQWLCDMLAHIVTIKASNACISDEGNACHSLYVIVMATKGCLFIDIIFCLWLL